MSSGAKTLAACMGLLWLLSAAGCRQQAAPAPPPAPVAQVQQQPPLTASNITVITPLPSVPATAAPNVQPAAASTPAAPQPVEQVKHRRHHLRRSKEPVELAQVTPPPQQQQKEVAAPTTPAQAAPSALVEQKTGVPTSEPPATTQAANGLTGQWSTGTAISTQERTRMLSAIQVQEQRISTIRNARQPETANVLLQVRSFLEKARQAVSDNDLDGAETLNTKARVLLDELQGS